MITMLANAYWAITAPGNVPLYTRHLTHVTAANPQSNLNTQARVHLCLSSVVSNSLWPNGLWPARLLCPWGFSRQVYWSGLPFPSPGDHSDPGMEHPSPALAGELFTHWAIRETPIPNSNHECVLYQSLLLKYELWSCSSEMEIMEDFVISILKYIL